MKGIKVVTIGGGSSYTPELVEGFIKRYDELPVKELWLVDIEEGREKLTIVGNLAKRMVKKAGIDMKIYITLDRREALKNADFVTTQFRVGLLDAREKDELIPLKYGVIGQETNGPGGMCYCFFHFFHLFIYLNHSNVIILLSEHLIIALPEFS